MDSVRACLQRCCRGGTLLLLGLWGCAAGGVFHPVHEGETLYRISRTYGVDEHYLARINGISDPGRIKTGDRIFIPGSSQVREVPGLAQVGPPTPRPATGTVARSEAAPVKSSTPAKKSQPAKKPPTPRPASAVVATAAPTAAAKTPPPTVSSPAPASAAAPNFAWPLQGEILRRFGDAGTPPSKGLEIAAAAGTPITAAAAGKVIYSGDGIRSYGNLIIIRHDDAFFTVYGYNERNLVTAGTFVSKGEKVALAGAPPAGGKARLYFEIRRGKDAVNPTIYLP